MELYDVNLDTQAALLLTSRLRQSAQDSVMPLRPSEYLNLIKAMQLMNLQPGDLFEESNLQRVVEAKIVEPERMADLFARRLILAMVLEKWSAQGIWVMGWSDHEYPSRYRDKLKGQAPPVLYGIGDKTLLAGGGVAIVGSRDVDEQGTAFAEIVAQTCTNINTAVISGGARGVDSVAMLACLDCGGNAVGVLSDSLERIAVSPRFRDAIMRGSLVLVSPFEPESRFFVGSAMARNKLIYALADIALVISSDYKKGGTWAGAIENLEKHLAPLFVRKSSSVPEGNLRLLDVGGIPVDESSVDGGNIVEWMRQEASSRDAAVKPQNAPQGTLSLF